MFINARVRRLARYAFIGFLALGVGCQEPAPTGTSADTKAKSESSTDPTAKKSTAIVDPKSVAEDGTVLLTPPSSTNSASTNPRLDVIVDEPKIPEDAKFGTPTLADPPAIEPNQVVAEQPAPAEPALAEPAPTQAAAGEPTLAVSGEPTLADPDLGSKNLGTAKSSKESNVVTEAPDVQLNDPVANQPAPVGSNLATASELNQKIAEDWPTPQAVLFLTGQQHGYMEPCGCTGLDRQKGGIIRRDTLIQELSDRGWNVVPVDVGNQVRRTGKQAEMQFRTTADAFKKMNYKAVAFGLDDLRLSTTFVVQVAASDNMAKPEMFTSANMSIIDPSFWPKTQVVEVGGRKIGITAHIGEEYFADLEPNKSITTSDSVSSLQTAVKELKDKGCDYIVLLSHANQQDSERVAAKVPGIDLVVTAGGHGEPRNVLDPIPGSTAMISQVGTKGMFACIVGLFDDAKTPVRYQRIAISSQFKDSPRMLEAFKQYQEQLKSEGFVGLGVKYRSAPKSGEYVGSEACGDCHTTAFGIWERSKHFHATDSIIQPNNARGAIPRHFDPECVSCHVTGWDPQNYEPFETGYWSLEKTPKLVGSGCENCHGPGSEHVNAESGDADAELLNKLREQMRLPLKLAEAKCVECHDTDNSPDFKFDKYWEEVKHIGKD
ncbi:MAG: multiheme c-type cytochrome [Pirellulaceae bacterium]|nr:multiheme c-type cytochrome [Pirellulaceae bacterium]